MSYQAMEPRCPTAAEVAGSYLEFVILSEAKDLTRRVRNGGGAEILRFAQDDGTAAN